MSKDATRSVTQPVYRRDLRKGDCVEINVGDHVMRINYDAQRKRLSVAVLPIDNKASGRHD